MAISPPFGSCRSCLESNTWRTKAPSPVSYDLFDVRQYQGETLKEYINLFGAQVVKVGTSEEPMIVYAFRKGVCPGPFLRIYYSQSPEDFC